VGSSTATLGRWAGEVKSINEMAAFAPASRVICARDGCRHVAAHSLIPPTESALHSVAG
jgi:hypothetical protein